MISPSESISKEQQEQLYTSKPVTIYALVTRDGGNAQRIPQVVESFVIQTGENGPELRNDEEGEYTYVECDYGNLSGLLTFDGVLYTKTDAWDNADEDDRESLENNEGITFWEWDLMYQGAWRPMTVAEAQSLGLFPVEAPHV